MPCRYWVLGDGAACLGTHSPTLASLFPACCAPTGCLNGGGQLKSPNKPAKELLEHVERLYREVKAEEPEEVPGIQDLYRDWLQGEGSELADRLLHTSYHAVAKAASSLSIRW